MVRNERAMLALGLVPLCVGAALLMLAFMLGFPLLTAHDPADSAKAQLIAVPAAIALAAGVVALAGRRRGWALAVGCVGAAAAVLAILLTALVPGS